MNIDPRGMTASDWCQRMVPELRQFGLVPFLFDDAGWPQWVGQISIIEGLEDTPDPDGFQSFEEWAMSFNLVVPL